MTPLRRAGPSGVLPDEVRCQGGAPIVAAVAGDGQPGCSRCPISYFSDSVAVGTACARTRLHVE